MRRGTFGVLGLQGWEQLPEEPLSPCMFVFLREDSVLKGGMRNCRVQATRALQTTDVNELGEHALLQGALGAPPLPL